MSFRHPGHSHDDLLYKRFVLVYEKYRKLIATHESMVTKPKYTSLWCIYVTEFRQPLQVQSHLEMPGILVQLGHIQRT